MTGLPCIRDCGLPATVWHHVIYKQVVRREHGDVDDPRNLVPICDRCHVDHHDREDPLELTDLPDSVYEFAAELLGPGKAFNALRRAYAGDDPRLEALCSSSPQ